MRINSTEERNLWAQFDALQLGSGWSEEDLGKPQILIDDAYGESHPGSVHLNQISQQVKYGVYEKGACPASFHITDICDGCAQGHDGMNLVLLSREVMCDMLEIHAGYVPWDGLVLSASCDKAVPAYLQAAARINLPTIFIPGGCMRSGPNQTTSLVCWEGRFYKWDGQHHAVYGGGSGTEPSRQRFGSRDDAGSSGICQNCGKTDCGACKKEHQSQRYSDYGELL